MCKKCVVCMCVVREGRKCRGRHSAVSSDEVALTCAVNRGVRTRVGTCRAAARHLRTGPTAAGSFSFSRLWFFGTLLPFGLCVATCKRRPKPPYRYSSYEHVPHVTILDRHAFFGTLPNPLSCGDTGTRVSCAPAVQIEFVPCARRSTYFSRSIRLMQSPQAQQRKGSHSTCTTRWSPSLSAVSLRL